MVHPHICLLTLAPSLATPPYTQVSHWSDPKTLFVLVTHKFVFEFVFVKELFCVPKTPYANTNVIRD